MITSTEVKSNRLSVVSNRELICLLAASNSASTHLNNEVVSGTIDEEVGLTCSIEEDAASPVEVLEEVWKRAVTALSKVEEKTTRPLVAVAPTAEKTA